MNKIVGHDGIKSLLESEARILLALSAGQMSGYEIARQCEQDAAGEITMSNGTVYPTLKRMEEWGAVVQVGSKDSGPGKPARIWRLSRAGRMMLELELASYRRLVRLGQERL